MQKKKWNVLAVCLFFLLSCTTNKKDAILIDVAREGAEISPSLYGIFFEEITHSGDGGLYAEMIRNRGFEDGTPPSGTQVINNSAVAAAKPCYSNDSINHFKIPWDDSLYMDGWTVENEDGSTPEYAIVSNEPLHPATPHALSIAAGKSKGLVRLMNSGYWGIALKKGEDYTMTIHLKYPKGYQGAFQIELVDTKGTSVWTAGVMAEDHGKWQKYTTFFTSYVTANDLKLVLTFDNQEPVLVDYVSLFPRETFHNHPNGLRNDVAEMLADLKPAFVRWPGGCIVEGLTFENRVKWKETIGDPVTRPGEYNLWGYRSTYGFGYHEFLQFCEDTGAKGMFVCNAGMSCLFRNGDFCNANQLDDLIQEALDAIEYALGDTTTTWGKMRAQNGHPGKFPLEYIEIGNENIGQMYAVNYNRFYKAIRAQYPDLKIICALMFSKYLANAEQVDIIDPHYYETAGWFYNNADVYDKLPAGYPYHVYVGEYAAIGGSNLNSSLAEAAFLTGVERNGDKIKMVSYAPLLENAAHGKDHLIVLKNDSVYGRTNYHVLKLFSHNRPDVNLATQLIPVTPSRPYQSKGFIGLGSDNTCASFKELKITQQGKVVYETDFSDWADKWNPLRGEWLVENGMAKQQKQPGDALAILNGFSFEDCTIELKARRDGGVQGFRILFGGKDDWNYFMADIGSHTNESVLFREITDHSNTSLFDYRVEYPVQMNHWYDVKIVIEGNHWSCFLDGELVYEYTCKNDPRHYVVSGYDKAKEEVVIKVVNGEDTPWNTSVQLQHVQSLGTDGKIICLSHADKLAENSFGEPNKIIPQETDFKVKSTFDYSFEPHSLTILRIPCKKNNL